MILFISGTEPYLIREQLGRLTERAGKDADVVRLDGAESKIGDVRQSLSAESLFATGKRLVIVEDWLTSHSPSDNEALAELLDGAPKETIVVVVERGDPDRRQKAVKRIEKLAERTWKFEPSEPAAARRWLATEAKRRNIDLPPALAGRLIETVGTDLWTLSNELDKLGAAAHGRKGVSDAMVDQLVTGETSGNIWDLVDALSKGDARAGITNLQRLLSDGEPPLRIFAMIVRQFRILLGVKSMVSETDAAIATRLGIHPFAAKQARRFVDRFSEEDLKRVFDELAELDVQMKTGKRDPEAALELFIAERGGVHA